MLNSLQTTLFKRYSLSFIAVFTLMGLAYLALSFGLANHHLQQVQTRVHLHVADNLIQDHQLIQQGQINQTALSETFQRYMMLNPYLEIYRLNPKGQVLQYSADAKKIKLHQVDISPIQKFLNTASSSDIFPQGDDPRRPDQQSPFSVAKLPNGDYLYVIIQTSIDAETDRQLQESLFLELSAWSFLISLLLGLLLSGGLFYHLTQRIQRLGQAVDDFAQQPEQSDQLITKPYQIKDDLDRLHHQVAQMSQQIQHQIQALQQTDQQRRFMISSLSHDLRTPLTNLLGFMEQTQSSQNFEHLEIAYQNGLRLKHYLNQLFDYSKLDLDSFQLHKQELSLSEFGFDLLQTYRQNHPEQDWQFDVSENIVCHFDPNALERAIANLLDNAVRYGTGKIVLAIHQTETNAYIDVCNEGAALPASFKQQNFIAFSQVHPFRHATPNANNQSGLGLSIVQSISEKHGGQLRYHRTQQRNCFQIKLPINE